MECFLIFNPQVGGMYAPAGEFVLARFVQTYIRLSVTFIIRCVYVLVPIRVFIVSLCMFNLTSDKPL